MKPKAELFSYELCSLKIHLRILCVLFRLNADLLDIRQIFNGANYNVVQQFDISSREFVEQFSLLYETNSDKVQSVALYDHEGKLIASEPVALEKKNVQVQTQEWYENAENAIENVHFSTPHIQELFEDGAYRYCGIVLGKPSST